MPERLGVPARLTRDSAQGVVRAGLIQTSWGKAAADLQRLDLESLGLGQVAPLERDPAKSAEAGCAGQAARGLFLLDAERLVESLLRGVQLASFQRS